MLIRAFVELIFEISSTYEYLGGEPLVARQICFPAVFVVPAHFELVFWAYRDFWTFAAVIVTASLITRALSIVRAAHDASINTPEPASPTTELTGEAPQQPCERDTRDNGRAQPQQEPADTAAASD